MLPVIVYKKHNVLALPGDRLALLLRSIFGCSSLLMNYESLRLLPLGDSSAITHSSPVFVALFACIFLNEPCGMIQNISLFMAIFGFFLIARPSFLFHHEKAEEYADTRTKGTILAFISCICQASTIVCIRRLKNTPTSVVIFWHSITTMILGFVLTSITGTLKAPASVLDVALLIVCGMTGAIAQFLLTMALKIEHAGPVSLARTTDIVIAFLYQFLILKEKIHWISLLGASISSFAVVIIALDKWYHHQPEAFKSIICCRLWSCGVKHTDTYEDLRMKSEKELDPSVVKM